jgi:hypothetical protein
MTSMTVQEVCNRLMISLDELTELVDRGQLSTNCDGYIWSFSVQLYLEG